VQGVIRGAANQRNPTIPAPLDRIRAVFDGSFATINSTVANVFAADQNRREMLRVSSSVTFVSGDGDLPDNVLEKFIEDGTFSNAASTTTKYSFRRYPEWLRDGDTRLGYWTVIGTTMKAKTPATVTAFTGTATVSFICSPEVPAEEDDEFVAPADFVSDFENAMVQYIQGQIAELAATTA